MTDIGELVVRVKADASQLQQEMTKTTTVVKQQAGQMESAVGGLKDQFRGLIPAVTVASVAEFGRRAFEAADHLNDLALRTGFAASTLSALNIPLKQSGSSVDDFSGSINRMNNLIGEAAKGTNQEAVKAFDALGLSVRKLQQLSPEDQFFAIAEALGKMDNQSAMTNAGMAIFGRSFASIIPLIKEAGGNLKEFTDEAKRNGDALTEEQLKRIDAWGDRWTSAIEHAKLGLIDMLDYLAQLSEAAAQANAADQSGMWGTGKANPRVSTTRPSSVGEATFLNQGEYGDDFPSLYPTRMGSSRSGGAKGSNAGLLTPPKDSALKEYITNLKLETAAIGLNERALFVARAEIEATAKAKADFNDKLRASKDLLPEERANVETLAGSYYDLKKAQEENARMAKRMQEALSDSLAEIAVNFESLEDTATSAIQAIAKEIIKAKITGPLAKGIVDAMPSFSFGGIGKLLGFADGGNPPVGVPSIVGERGPEIFVPNTAGTVIPNNKLGGQTVVVQQTINLSPGLAETVNAAIMNAAPHIAGAAKAAVFDEMQRGGTGSRITGLRS